MKEKEKIDNVFILLLVVVAMGRYIGIRREIKRIGSFRGVRRARGIRGIRGIRRSRK